jgi:Acyclic terpene utilisation family protein AtuA
MTQVVRIGGASAFWGDSVLGPRQLASEKLDFIVFDYLAELTMSILAAQKSKDSQLGYATDFITVAMKLLCGPVAEGRYRVISNAGGLNPKACAQALHVLAKQQGVQLRVAVVEGDDVLAEANAITAKHDSRSAPLLTANAYLGAWPIKAALDAGAQVVITGRCVDSAVTVGALAHSFGWEPSSDLEALNQLAQASLAGHIIECGCQGVGGLLTDWQTVPDWANMGYPIVEFSPDGSFSVTKPANTGGLVNCSAVAEQIVYEVHDPAQYILPDVTCDFSNVQLESISESRVRVTGALGFLPPSHLKVSATYLNGYRCNAQLTIIGIDASAKAIRTAQALFERIESFLQQLQLGPFTQKSYEVLGASDTAFEVVLFLAVTHNDKRALELFAREIAPAGTAFSPGTTGVSGRPSVTPVVRQHTLYIERLQVMPRVLMVPDAVPNEPFNAQEIAWTPTRLPTYSSMGNDINLGRTKTAQQHPTLIDLAAGQTIKARLIDIAHGRSGDKGDTSNIGILARSAQALDWLQVHLTEAVVAQWLAPWVKGSVKRYAWPGLMGFNFVCDEALGGGGMASLRNDPLGKGMAQRLLAMPIEISDQILLSPAQQALKKNRTSASQ